MIKNKRKLIIPAIILVVFLVAMFLSQSKTNLIQELRGPKAGVRGVFTSAGKLAVLSGQNEVYTWDWSDLRKWPTVARLKTERLCPMAPGRIVYLPNDRPDTVTITDLKGEKEIKQIPLPFGVECEQMIPSADCSCIALLLKQDHKSRLALIDPELQLSEIASVPDEQMEIFKIGVSNDGQFIAAAGEKNGGVAMVFSTDTRKPVFEESIEDILRFDNVIFSPDNKIAYFGERVRFIYAFEMPTGDLLKIYEIPEYPPVPQKKQIISAIDISPDGRVLAASTEPVQKLYLWNTETGEKITEFGLPGPVVGDIAFAPDSARIATSVLVRSTISIWKATE